MTLLTIEEIESACAGRAAAKPDPHPVDAPALTLQAKFFPLGFPLEVRTNSEDVLALCRTQWGYFEQRFDTEPIIAEVYLVESTQDAVAQQECPPQPQYRFVEPLLAIVADPYHYSIADLSVGRTTILAASAALRHPLYFRYFFLECGAGVHIATRHTTPVHAGCVTLNGRGILLCGDSGAGKSSLSFACARAGWGYVSDDACFLLHGRRVIGNCHQVRLRPTAADLFPEIAGLPLTPRAEGKPSIELLTGSLPHVRRQHSADVNAIVFLNRRVHGTSGLFPYSRDVARRYMRQQLFGSRASLARQYDDVERLLEADVLELRYQTLDQAVQYLRILAEGR